MSRCDVPLENTALVCQHEHFQVEVKCAVPSVSPWESCDAPWMIPSFSGSRGLQCDPVLVSLVPVFVGVGASSSGLSSVFRSS